MPRAVQESSECWGSEAAQAQGAAALSLLAPLALWRIVALPWMAGYHVSLSGAD